MTKIRIKMTISRWAWKNMLYWKQKEKWKDWLVCGTENIFGQGRSSSMCGMYIRVPCFNLPIGMQAVCCIGCWSLWRRWHGSAQRAQVHVWLFGRRLYFSRQPSFSLCFLNLPKGKKLFLRFCPPYLTHSFGWWNVSRSPYIFCSAVAAYRQGEGDTVLKYTSKFLAVTSGVSLQIASAICCIW